MSRIQKIIFEAVEAAEAGLKNSNVEGTRYRNEGGFGWTFSFFRLQSPTTCNSYSVQFLYLKAHQISIQFFSIEFIF